MRSNRWFVSPRPRLLRERLCHCVGGTGEAVERRATHPGLPWNAFNGPMRRRC